jgi:hypothetical protein
VLGDGNIIFFIYVLQESMYTPSGQNIRIQHKALKQTMVIVPHDNGIKNILTGSFTCEMGRSFLMQIRME